MTGKKIKSQLINRQSALILMDQPGVYIVEIITGNGEVFSTKIIFH
ncbi:T9SS type A sorting domain-containing protein [Chryseobacterium suipulveris]